MQIGKFCMINAKRIALCTARRDGERDGRSGMSVKSWSRPSRRLRYALCGGSSSPYFLFFIINLTNPAIVINAAAKKRTVYRLFAR